MWKVYRIINKKFNTKSQCYKSYIGITRRSIEERFQEHCDGFGSKILFSAIKKHGLNNFEIIILKNNIKTEIEALDLESQFISEYNVLVRNGKGYNVQARSEPRKIINNKLTCNNCNVLQDVNLFSKCSNDSTGFCSICKQCKKEYNIKTREHRLKTGKEYEKKNADKIKIVKRNYRENTKQHRRNLNKKYQNNIKENNLMLTFEEIMLATPIKTCCICKVEKSSDNFHRSNKAKDGLKHSCKNCRSIKHRQQK